MKLKKELNKWQCGISFEKSPLRCDGYYNLKIWFLKFMSFPSVGEGINENNYKGFFLIFKIKSPIYKHYSIHDGYVVRTPSIIKIKI